MTAIFIMEIPIHRHYLYWNSPCAPWASIIWGRVPIMTSYLYKDNLCFGTSPCFSWASLGVTITNECLSWRLIVTKTVFVSKQPHVSHEHLTSGVSAASWCRSWRLIFTKTVFVLKQPHVTHEHLKSGVSTASWIKTVFVLKHPIESHEHPSSWVSTTSWCLPWRLIFTKKVFLLKYPPCIAWASIFMSQYHQLMPIMTQSLGVHSSIPHTWSGALVLHIHVRHINSLGPGDSTCQH